jgi:hypothetical protein
MSQSGRFVTIQVKKGGRFVTAKLRPPLGLGGPKIPERFARSKNVTVDVMNARTLCWVEVLRVSKLY